MVPAPDTAYLIETLPRGDRTVGNTKVAIKGPHHWLLWSPSEPTRVHEARWHPRWPATELPADSSLFQRAMAAIQTDAAERDAREKAKAQNNFEKEVKAQVDAIEDAREREIRAATYAMWRPTALTRKDLILRGWSFGLISLHLQHNAVERKSTGGGHVSRTFLYDPAQVSYLEELLRDDLDRILARRKKKGLSGDL